MDRNAVIIVTGAAGFIGSCLTGYLNRKGYNNIIIVDDFNDDKKKHNYDEKKICARVDKDELFDWLNRYKIRIDFIFHMGAPAEINETAASLNTKLSADYSENLWSYCSSGNIPFVYASSADTDVVNESSNEFDKWVLQQQAQPPFWAGLKFVNVYGPNEYHKGLYASAIYNSYYEAQANGKICLNKSKEQDEPRQDFVYVKDVVDICYWLMQRSTENNDIPASGLYNIGTGKARSLQDVVNAVFRNIEKEPKIEYTDTSMVINKRSSFKEADISKLRNAGYSKEFYSLEEGVKTYVQHFLNEGKYY